MPGVVEIHQGSGLVMGASVLVLLRAFANGGSSLTGVEAISSTVSFFRKPQGPNARRVLTREQILEHVWEYTFAGNASVLETYISYLRHKVDEGERPLIHTVRGVGYTLRLPR